MIYFQHVCGPKDDTYLVSLFQYNLRTNGWYIFKLVWLIDSSCNKVYIAGYRVYIAMISFLSA